MIGDPADSSCMRNASLEDVLAAQKATQQKIPLLHPMQLFYPWTPLSN